MNSVNNTQELLLNLGESAIRSRGYSGFSYGDIARDAGIRKASIHHHFPTKRDFGLAVLDRYADRMARDLQAIDGRNRLGAHALAEAIKLYRDAVAESNQLCLCVALSADSELISAQMRFLVAKANQMCAQWFEQVLIKGRRDRSIAVGGDPADEAVSLLAQLQGAQLLARIEGSVDSFDRAIASITSRMTRR